MDKRNDIEIIINQFLACTTQPIEFIEDLLYDLDSFEKKENLIIDLKKFLKSNYLDSFLKSFYENQIQSIPIDSGLIKTKDMTQSEHIEEIGILRTEAFNKRVNELQSITDKVLPNILKSFQDGKPISYGEPGLNYNKSQIAKGKLYTFYDELIDKKLIEPINKKEFFKFFKETFEPNENRIVWIANINKLSYLFNLIVEDKKNFDFKRKRFRRIIPMMFEWKKRNKKAVIVTPNQLSGNSNPKMKEPIIDKIFKELS